MEKSFKGPLHGHPTSPNLEVGLRTDEIGLRCISARPPCRLGRKPKFDWMGVVKIELFRLMDYHGGFHPCDKDWSCQADAVRAMDAFLKDKYGVSAAPSTLRRWAKHIIGEWKPTRIQE